MNSVSVCTYVCLSAGISRKPHGQTSVIFFYMLPASVDRSFSDDTAICCVCPGLWMTSWFHVMEQNELDDVSFGRVRQMAALGGGDASRLCLLGERILLYSIALFYRVHLLQLVLY